MLARALCTSSTAQQTTDVVHCARRRVQIKLRHQQGMTRQKQHGQGEPKAAAPKRTEKATTKVAKAKATTKIVKKWLMSIRIMKTASAP